MLATLLAFCGPVLAQQRMQFPTQLPVDSAPALGPNVAPSPGPGATFQGTIQPSPSWDPYATPCQESPTLFPQDPTLPSMAAPGAAVGGGLASAQRFMRDVRLDYTWLVGHGGEELGINDIGTSTSFALPFFYNQQTPLLVTPGFGLHLFEGPQRPFPDLPGMTYDAYVDAAWNPQVNSWFGADLDARVGVYTDFNTICTESIRVTGHGYGVLSFTPSFQVKAGVIYLDRVKVKILPAGGIVWTPNPDVRFDVLFPNPKFARRLSTIGNTDWWVYFRGDYGGGTWTIMHLDHEIERIDYNDIRIAVGFEFRGLRGTLGHFEVGGSFDREIIYHNHPNEAFRPNPTVFIGGGMVF